MIHKIVKHFLIWVLVIALLIIFTNQNENLWDRTKNILIIFPVLLIQYYFHLFLYNRFFEKNVTKYYYGESFPKNSSDYK
jgi:ACR3 family arsenite efflux pump ArsB